MWGLAKWGRDWLDEGVYITTGLLLNGVIKAWFALEAGRRLAEDRKEGALELLLSTPLTVQDILRGQWLALRRQFQGPMTMVLLSFLLFMLLGAVDPLSRSELATPPEWVLLWTAAIVMLIADLAGLYWFGLWRGIKAKNPDRAGVQNLRCILLLPWVITIVVMLVAPALWTYGVRVDLGTLVLALWFGLGLVVDVWFGSWARHKLLTEFRLAATRRYEVRRGFWEHLFMGPCRFFPSWVGNCECRPGARAPSASAPGRWLSRWWWGSARSFRCWRWGPPAAWASRSTRS